MGSLRNPVGPLPSSIYWRRRAALLSLFAVLALLAAWVVTSGGGGGNGSRNSADGKNPAPTITPGPSDSGPAISQAPGGRDESEDGDTGGTGDGPGDGDGDGSGSGDVSGSGDGGSGGAGGSGGPGGGPASGTGAGTGSGDTVPAGSPLPNCTPSAVKLSLRSLRNTYEPGQMPTFVLAARNISGSDCKMDFGPESAVLTVTPATADDAFWASDDCPEAAGSRFYRVPSDSGITYTVKWDRKPGAPECATPSAGVAKPGTYLVEAKAPGFAKVQTSFVIEAA
ncbi:hypothetical protein ABZ354_14520 [Streptomyces sp. NPDC005925]|uniref:hypothetical protein n=1 Tax=Streptomyces sp. NPDC005925 TaxID=3157172 RepID=UPI0033F41957